MALHSLLPSKLGAIEAQLLIDGLPPGPFSNLQSLRVDEGGFDLPLPIPRAKWSGTSVPMWSGATWQTEILVTRMLQQTPTRPRDTTRDADIRGTLQDSTRKRSSVCHYDRIWTPPLGSRSLQANVDRPRRGSVVRAANRIARLLGARSGCRWGRARRRVGGSRFAHEWHETRRTWPRCT